MRWKRWDVEGVLHKLLQIVGLHKLDLAHQVVLDSTPSAQQEMRGRSSLGAAWAAWCTCGRVDLVPARVPGSQGHTGQHT